MGIRVFGISPVLTKNKMTSIFARLFSKRRKRKASTAVSGAPEGPSCLVINDVLRERFVVESVLGFGSFGEIYKVYDRKMGIHAALKSEHRSIKQEKRREQLPLELAVMKKMQGIPHFAQLYSAGAEAAFNFIVMQVLGPCLSDYRRMCPVTKDRRFSTPTALKLGIQTVEALKSLHEAGIIHRDLKASNLVMGLPNTGDQDTVFLLDFGLSRFYRNEDGEHRPSRKRAPFRGTLRYCAIAAHKRKDLGRRDDLESLFYTLYEFLNGSLPWSAIRLDKDIQLWKEELYNFDELCKNLPVDMKEFTDHLASLLFADTPNYDKLIGVLLKIAKDNDLILTDCKFDWQNKFEYLDLNEVGASESSGA